VHCAPQGAVLGPILFLLYIADLMSLIEDRDLCLHLYTNDTQICGFCSPSASLHNNNLSVCIDDVVVWMHSNRLQLNTTKTEIIWSTTGRRFHQLPVTASASSWRRPCRTGFCGSWLLNLPWYRRLHLLCLFRSRLKAFLFRRSFPWLYRNFC